MHFFPDTECCFCGQGDHVSAACHTFWTSQCLVVKHGFLEVEDPLNESCRGFQIMRRQTSDPVCSPGGFQPPDVPREAGPSFRPCEGDVEKKSRLAPTVSAMTTCDTLDPFKATTLETIGSMDEQHEVRSHASEDASEPSYCGHGELPSVGSAKHFEEGCKPCAFLKTEGGCKNGPSCRFCHFEHLSAKRERIRPCKGKRERLKRTVDRLLRDIDTSAEALRRSGVRLDVNTAVNAFMDSVDLPPMVQDNNRLKNMIFNRLQGYATQAFQEAGEPL
mmetsp:Transcript_110877/g.286643  ORF Transcript_110877/g.286643 Transcript_110877/m.286643 type:complete len:276 (+) Transcript_110877:80-907(+)